ncbi:MAG: thioredoxin domain-containing protein [Candidatus Dormibacteria bacterium]
MNRLGEESSPYLRQHKDNPVDWYPWGEEAFQRAQREDRPILLSVGYSACHWCHVMAHECFENPLLAELQNGLFVNVKVDREERPDVDRVYMDALQALTGSGGWPMTAFLLPDGRPFFAGTYFPPEDRPGLPGFRRAMETLAAAYRERRSEVVARAERLSEALKPAPLVSPPPRATRLGEVLAAAEEQLVHSADLEYGGFGGAPKFPQCAALDFLLTRAVLEQSPRSAEVVRRSLQAMAAGGIRDQLGEGFHRYSVDRRWAVPHFEKMLYDNAQLVRLYLRSWRAYGDPRHLVIASRTADFLIDQMGLPGGGFAASFDADTAAGDGAFYAWTPEQLAAVLGPERLELVAELFGGPGDAHTELGGMVLRGGIAPGPAGAERGLGESESPTVREQVAQELLKARADRTVPARDDKLIVGWNGLAISALAELGLGSGDPRYLAVARNCAVAVLRQATSGGELHHLFDGTRARFTAGLDDLAAMGLAALSLHEATGETSWYELALELGRRVEREYRDPAGPGWFDTPTDHDPHLQARPRSLEDGAQPSGISLMSELCLRLYALSGDANWLQRASAVLEAMASAAERFPSAFGALLSMMAILNQGQVELALVVPDLKSAHLPLLRRARSQLRPELVVGVGRVSPGRADAEVGPPLVLSRPLLEGAPTAYVCRKFTCRLPVGDAEGLDRELARISIA